MKAMTDLMSPEAVAEQSSLTLETVRSHKMVRRGLCDAIVCDVGNALCDERHCILLLLS